MINRRTLFILFHGRFPSEKAAALFVIENARSFAGTFNVHIVAPRRLGRGEDKVDLPKDITITYLPVLDLFSAPFVSFLAFYISMLTYLPFATLFLISRARKGDCIISNDFLLAIAASVSRARVIFEVHDYPEHWKQLYRLLFKRVALVIATNNWKYRTLLEEFPETAGKILMERNAVDFSRFGGRETREECRRVISLPEDARIVVYTGHLYSWKGIETLISAARSMSDIRFVFVGGTPEESMRYRTENRAFENITFTGHVPHSEVVYWQGAADVLVLPNTAKEEISSHYTSPMKLFEYMASRRPIVASRIPSIEELLDERNAYLFEPDNATSLEKAIRSVFEDLDEARERAARARERVEEHSWSARATRLLAVSPLNGRTV